MIIYGFIYRMKPHKKVDFLHQKMERLQQHILAFLNFGQLLERIRFSLITFIIANSKYRGLKIS